MQEPRLARMNASSSAADLCLALPYTGSGPCAASEPCDWQQPHNQKGGYPRFNKGNKGLNTLYEFFHDLGYTQCVMRRGNYI